MNKEECKYISNKFNNHLMIVKNANFGTIIPLGKNAYSVYINDECLNGYTIGKLIGSGSYGSVYSLKSQKTKQSYVVKFVALVDKDDKTDYINEVKYHKEMNKLNIGATIIYDAICKGVSYNNSVPPMFKDKSIKYKDIDVGVIFMEKWDGDLENVSNTFINSQSKKIVHALLPQLINMHKHLYVHYDIDSRNILYRKKNGTYQFTLSDFGLMKKFTSISNATSYHKYTTHIFNTYIKDRTFSEFIGKLESIISTNLIIYYPQLIDYFYIMHSNILSKHYVSALLSNKSLLLTDSNPIRKMLYTVHSSLLKFENINDDKIQQIFESLDKGNCPSGTLLNPKTKRCIKDTPANRKRLNVSTKQEKCPPGTLLNPKTKRCIKDTPANRKRLN